MPKRKRQRSEYDEIRHKIRRLEKELYRVRDKHGGYNEYNEYDEYEDYGYDEEYQGYYSEYTESGDPNSIHHEPENREPDNIPPSAPSANHTVVSSDMHKDPIAIMDTAEETITNKTTTEELQKEYPTLDSSILEILGADPSDNVEYGKEIRSELASRLEHIATTGLAKDIRQELLQKYLLPANCTKIGAPVMNAEIKAAVTEIVTKRDKGIELRQKQLACAIAATADMINKELAADEKDNNRLKQIMDIGRILCDIQYQQSVTRRNFAIFSIKKDLKDHVANAKIDKYLFGEGLAETLKTAKAVSKSGTDLKAKTQIRGKPFTNATNNLKIPDLIKTSKPGCKQPTLVLPFFLEKPEICPATTLSAYLDKTKPLRRSSQLFISFKKPHDAVSGQSLSRWIKSTLKNSGIDDSIFTAHSTRHAATSKALRCGVTVDAIRNTAGWSGGSNTFGKFYNRVVISNDNSALAKAVFSSHTN